MQTVHRRTFARHVPVRPVVAIVALIACFAAPRDARAMGTCRDPGTITAPHGCVMCSVVTPRLEKQIQLDKAAIESYKQKIQEAKTAQKDASAGLKKADAEGGSCTALGGKSFPEYQEQIVAHLKSQGGTSASSANVKLERFEGSGCPRLSPSGAFELQDAGTCKPTLAVAGCDDLAPQCWASACTRHEQSHIQDLEAAWRNAAAGKWKPIRGLEYLVCGAETGPLASFYHPSTCPSDVIRALQSELEAYTNELNDLEACREQMKKDCQDAPH